MPQKSSFITKRTYSFYAAGQMIKKIDHIARPSGKAALHPESDFENTVSEAILIFLPLGIKNGGAWWFQSL